MSFVRTELNALSLATDTLTSGEEYSEQNLKRKTSRGEYFTVTLLENLEMKLKRYDFKEDLLFENSKRVMFNFLLHKTMKLEKKNLSNFYKNI